MFWQSIVSWPSVSSYENIYSFIWDWIWSLNIILTYVYKYRILIYGLLVYCYCRIDKVILLLRKFSCLLPSKVCSHGQRCKSSNVFYIDSCSTFHCHIKHLNIIQNSHLFCYEIIQTQTIFGWLYVKISKWLKAVWTLELLV